MKRLIFSGFSALVVLTATTPVWASTKGATQHNDICDSIFAAQPTGGVTLQRLETIKWCEKPQSTEFNSVAQTPTKQLNSQTEIQPRVTTAQDLNTTRSLIPSQRQTELQMRRSGFGGH